MQVRSCDRVRRRLVDELAGLSSGLLADGELSDAEVFFLMKWIDKNRELATGWPFDELILQLNKATVDGCVVELERGRLIELLLELSNAVFSDDVRVSSGLPLCEPVPDVGAGAFVFTGNFSQGARAECVRLTEQAGGEVHKVVKLATDYLVIGSFVSEDWKHSTYGSKIERAVELREKEGRLSIISEAVWLEWVLNKQS